MGEIFSYAAFTILFVFDLDSFIIMCLRKDHLGLKFKSDLLAS